MTLVISTITSTGIVLTADRNGDRDNNLFFLDISGMML